MQIDLSSPLAILLVFALGGLVWLSKWIGGVNEHKSEVGKFMEEIRDDIKKIFRRLPSKTLDRGSPIQLTALGDSRLEETAYQNGASRGRTETSSR